MYRVKRKGKRRRRMFVNLTYGQIVPLHAVITRWWDNKTLPIAFQRQLVKVRKALTANSEEMEEMRQRLLDKHVLLDEKGERMVDKDNNFIFEDRPAFEKEWAELMKTTFDCPSLSLEDFESLFTQLEVTPAMLEILLGDDDHTILVSTTDTGAAVSK